MSCRRPTTKNLIRKSKSCCKSRYDSDSTSDSSSESSDSSSSYTSSDSSCGCFDCDCYDYSPLLSPRRRKGKGKAKKRNSRATKTSKSCKSPCSAKTSKKKSARRTKGDSWSCACSKGDCSDAYSSDDDSGDCNDCRPINPRRKGGRKQPQQKAKVARGRASNDDNCPCDE
ncbi:uncharacterized protein LOC143356691 [Halictus rubicundus]|uniref:uncharacterized protein LOC143356691 n=1 Tax=Halictus rubicundus TaxID=77578 RepID=UPI00403617BA